MTFHPQFSISAPPRRQRPDCAITLTGARAARDASACFGNRGFRAAVLQVRIHLPHQRVCELSVRERRDSSLVETALQEAIETLAYDHLEERVVSNAPRRVATVTFRQPFDMLAETLLAHAQKSRCRRRRRLSQIWARRRDDAERQPCAITIFPKCARPSKRR